MMFLQMVGIVVFERGLLHTDQYTQEQFSQALAGNERLMMLAGIGSLLQLLGGLAVPIFAFLLVEGFLNTSSYKKYLLSLTVFALVSEVPYDLVFHLKVNETVHGGRRRPQSALPWFFYCPGLMLQYSVISRELSCI